MKALKIKIKGTKKALKEKMKGVKEAFNLSMLANIDLSNLSIDGIKEIIKDKINDIKRSLINKLKAKAKIILKSLTKKNLIETLKTEKTNLLERIKGMAHNASDIIETIGTGMGAAVDALEAVPIAGPALKLAAGIAAGTAVAGIGLAIKKAIDKGKEANVNADKETKKFEKSADKEKKKAEKEQEKKDKEKEKEENSKAKASTTQEKEKDDKDIDKTKDELDKFKTDDEKNGKAKPHKKGGLLGALLGGPKNDLLHYLNKNQIKALETGSKSKFANLMLKDPKKAANIIFMLNGGPMLLGFKDTKTEDLNNLESVTATNSNSNSSSSSKNTIWSKLKNKLSQKKLLSDDLSDEGYSQNIETAALQYEQTKNSANIISAFASGLGFAKLEDDSGTSLFTTTIRKTAQQEALTKNLGTATAASTTSTGTTAASTTSTDDDSSSSDNRFNGSKYIGYDEDGTWSNSTTNSDIDSSGYFSKSNSSSSKTLVTKILNNNWLKYKNDNNITDTTTTNGSSYPRKFLNSEYDKMYTAFISGVPFSGTTSKNYMHSKLASSISESDAWTVPDSIKNSDTEKNAVRDYINKKSGVKYTKYGLGISGLYGLGDENDEDFLDASGYALSKGYKEKDGGTYPQFFTDYLKKDNIEVENAGSVNKIKNRLASGSPVILMGKDESENGTTPYGAEPHYVVATGYDGKNIRVVDSESTNDYDIYNADKVLSHSSIKLGTTNSKKGKGRKVRSKSGRARKTSKNKKYDNKRTVGGSRTYSTTIIKSASDYGTSSSSKISNNYSKQNNSSRRVSNNRRKSYLKSGKGKYGRGYVEQINANPELLKGAQDGWTMYGILASVTLAQSIIESGFGTSNLAKNYHNWFGHTAGFASDKYMTGTYQGSHEWAVYASDGDCFRDHAYVLSGQSGNTRYMAAVGEADPRASITAIENGGYCEGDPNSYIDKVMNIIDSYNLTQFDVGEYNGVAAGSGAVVYSKTCWTGDSRTEQMANYFSDLEVYATKGGQTIDYFNQHYSEISDKEGYNIFCWYGVNGATASGAQKTAEAYNKLATDLKGKSQVFAGTIGHCPNGTGSGKVEGGAGQSIETQNEGVVTFNTELLQNLSSDIIVIDTYTYIKSLEDSMGAEAMTTDNLHYTKECSQKIREYVNQQIQAASATTTTATSDAGVAIGDLYVTLEGYVDAKDILSQYASGDDIWDGVSSYNYVDSSDYTSTAAANYDPTSSSEDDETSTATPTASSSSSSTPTSSSTPSSSDSTSSSTSSSTPSSSDSTSSSTSSSTPSSSGSTSGSTNNPTTTTTTTTPTVSTPTDSNTSTEIYQSNGTLYVVNNIEYGIKANIADILKEFNELNDIQDDSLDVLNVIYQKLLKRNGKSKNTKIDGYDYSLKYRRFV
jgi:lysozyme